MALLQCLLFLLTTLLPFVVRVSSLTTGAFTSCRRSGAPFLSSPRQYSKSHQHQSQFPSPVVLRSTQSESSTNIGEASSSETENEPCAARTLEPLDVDPKTLVKIFGRMAEKYIMLDETGGMCCYSACKDCEYRLPGGGYRMADQTASRPKWIPAYVTRTINGKDHTTKWSTDIFVDGPAVNKATFVERVQQLQYAPPLGGPYVGASSASLENDQEGSKAIEYLFNLLAGEKESLTKARASMRWKQLANGEEGITWASFQAFMSSGNQ